MIKINKHNMKKTGKSNPHTTPKKSAHQLTRYQRWRVRAHKKIEERLKEESKGMIILKFFVVPILVSIIVLFLYLFLDFESFQRVGIAMLLYFFPPAGKETVIPVGVAVGLHPVLIGLTIAFLDIIIALFLLWNYDFAKLAPILGPWMEKVEKRGGNKFKENPWLENLAFLGLVLFVMFPFQGSGGLVTSILGRVIGMNKYKVFLAICIGAVVGSLLIAYFSDYFIGFFTDLYQALIFLVAIAVILAIYNGFKYLRK